jgi:hypothetical protein
VQELGFPVTVSAIALELSRKQIKISTKKRVTAIFTATELRIR